MVEFPFADYYYRMLLSLHDLCYYLVFGLWNQKCLLTFSRSRSVDRDDLPRKLSHADDRGDPVENGTRYEEDGSQQ